MRAVLLATVCVAAACGGERAPANRTRGPLVVSLAATPAGAGDTVVATVDGRPVYASCVAAQTALHRGPDAAAVRRAALDDCVALELAAQEAERRGLAAAPELAEETTRIFAAALVDREFSAKYRTVADLPAGLVEDVFQRNARRMVRPEYRATFFMRVDYAGPAGTPEDQAAERTARNAYDAFLRGRSDLFPDDVRAAVHVMALAGQKLSEGTPEPTIKDGILLPYYRDPVFALTSVGQATAPVRGPFGWDVILYTDRLDARTQTRAELLEELFPRIRMRWFQLWTSQLEKSLGAERYYDDKTLPALLGEEGGA